MPLTMCRKMFSCWIARLNLQFFEIGQQAFAVFVQVLNGQPGQGQTAVDMELSIGM